MHPWIMQQVAEQRLADLRSHAAPSRRGVAGSSRWARPWVRRSGRVSDAAVALTRKRPEHHGDAAIHAKAFSSETAAGPLTQSAL
jgi:hypothetical protein